MARYYDYAILYVIRIVTKRKEIGFHNSGPLCAGQSYMLGQKWKGNLESDIGPSMGERYQVGVSNIIMSS